MDVDTRTEGLARKLVLHALPEAREWLIEGVEHVYGDAPRGKRPIFWVATIAAAVLVAAAVFFLTSCAEAPALRDLQPVREANALVFHSGIRTDQEGTPVLTLSGSHYEVGLQYGVLLKPEIRSVYHEFDRLLDDLSGGELRRFFFRLSLNTQIEAMRAALPSGFEDELRGIAEGSCIPYSDFLCFAMTPELLFDTSCTSIVIRHGDQIVQGRNFDFPHPENLVSRYPAIGRVAVDEKVPYVNVGFAGLPGVYTGLNERGIAASVNTAAFTRHAERTVIPAGFLVMSVLENSSCLRDVDAVMDNAAASHYFITISSRDERKAALYESLGSAITKVPMTTDVLFVANAPLTPANRRTNASILSQAEYNLARESALERLTADTPPDSLSDYLLGILGNHDFYVYHNFPAHQTFIQDSLKTINNYETIQSVLIDWSANRVIFSYRPSYAAYGPFLTYDLSTGRLTMYRGEDPFVTASNFLEDTDFLDAAFTVSRRTGMTLNRTGWEQVIALLIGYPGLNPFLRSDWTFSASLALGHLEEAQRAAREVDDLYPDYYLGPLDQGLAAYAQKSWSEARDYFFCSRPINSPATKLLAILYASLASRRLGDKEESRELRAQAVALLQGTWIPQDLDVMVRRCLHDDVVAGSLRDIIRREALERR